MSLSKLITCAADGLPRPSLVPNTQYINAHQSILTKKEVITPNADGTELLFYNKGVFRSQCAMVHYSEPDDEMRSYSITFAPDLGGFAAKSVKPIRVDKQDLKKNPNKIPQPFAWTEGEIKAKGVDYPPDSLELRALHSVPLWTHAEALQIFKLNGPKTKLDISTMLAVFHFDVHNGEKSERRVLIMSGQAFYLQIQMAMLVRSLQAEDFNQKLKEAIKKKQQGANGSGGGGGGGDKADRVMPQRSRDLIARYPPKEANRFNELIKAKTYLHKMATDAKADSAGDAPGNSGGRMLLQTLAIALQGCEAEDPFDYVGVNVGQNRAQDILQAPVFYWPADAGAASPAPSASASASASERKGNVAQDVHAYVLRIPNDYTPFCVFRLPGSVPAQEDGEAVKLFIRTNDVFLPLGSTTNDRLKMHIRMRTLWSGTRSKSLFRWFEGLAKTGGLTANELYDEFRVMMAAEESVTDERLIALEHILRAAIGAAQLVYGEANLTKFLKLLEAIKWPSRQFFDDVKKKFFKSGSQAVSATAAIVAANAAAVVASGGGGGGGGGGNGDKQPAVAAAAAPSPAAPAPAPAAPPVSATGGPSNAGSGAVEVKAAQPAPVLAVVAAAAAPVAAAAPIPAAAVMPVMATAVVVHDLAPVPAPAPAPAPAPVPALPPVGPAPMAVDENGNGHGAKRKNDHLSDAKADNKADEHPAKKPRHEGDNPPHFDFTRYVSQDGLLLHLPPNTQPPDFKDMALQECCASGRCTKLAGAHSQPPLPDFDVAEAAPAAVPMELPEFTVQLQDLRKQTAESVRALDDAVRKQFEDSTRATNARLDKLEHAVKTTEARLNEQAQQLDRLFKAVKQPIVLMSDE